MLYQIWDDTLIVFSNKLGVEGKAAFMMTSHAALASIRTIKPDIVFFESPVIEQLLYIHREGYDLPDLRLTTTTMQRNQVPENQTIEYHRLVQLFAYMNRSSVSLDEICKFLASEEVQYLFRLNWIVEVSPMRYALHTKVLEMEAVRKENLWYDRMADEIENGRMFYDPV